MVASEQECAVMGTRQDQERVENIVAVMRTTAVADAAQGRIHLGPGAGRVALSVGDKGRRWNLGCHSAVLAVAAG